MTSLRKIVSCLIAVVSLTVFVAAGRTEENADDTSSALFRRAHELLRAHEYQQAARLYESIAQQYPQSALADNALYRAGFVYRYKLRDQTSALNAYRTLSKIYPESLFADDAEYKAASVLTELNRTDEAEATMEALVNKHPKSVWAKRLPPGWLKGEKTGWKKGVPPGLLKAKESRKKPPGSGKGKGKGHGPKALPPAD